MATRKAADHTLYHLNPKGFWKKFRAHHAACAGVPLTPAQATPSP